MQQTMTTVRVRQDVRRDLERVARDLERQERRPGTLGEGVMRSLAAWQQLAEPGTAGAGGAEWALGAGARPAQRWRAAQSLTSAGSTTASGAPRLAAGRTARGS